MKIEIELSEPIANSELAVRINIKTNKGLKGTVCIDMHSLIPYARLASRAALDFLIISSCVYCIDRLIKRKTNSVDGWSRELSVTFPVSNVAGWKGQSRNLSDLLSFLTGDYWDTSFVKSKFELPTPEEIDFQLQEFTEVNLFSGGLDSLIGAIDALNDRKRKTFLISHYDPQMHGPKSDQSDLIEVLSSQYKDRLKNLPSIKVFLEASNSVKETTLRSRSILFMALATVVADTRKVKIVVPENGTVSLNYPLSPSRRSACSTRTTHPTLVKSVHDLLSGQGLTSEIVNPYEFQTKGEMVEGCRDIDFLKKILQKSNSCGKRGHRVHWEKPDASHCGVCMPCVYRRASLLLQTDKTTYGNQLNPLYPFHTKKGQDIGACLEYLKDDLSSNQIKQELLVNGVKDLANVKKYVKVVERTREELKAWVKKTGNSLVKQKAGII
jgi:7-cyano-7-deazaguanine synthase in queuosine biosynthesis